MGNEVLSHWKLGDNVKHASEYHQKGKEARVIILQLPSITG